MNEILHQAPPPGTPLKCNLGVLWDHSGIYLGNGRVAELNGDGSAVAVSLSRFLNGGIGQYDPTLIRTGYRIFAACDAKTGEPLWTPESAKTARDMTDGSPVTVSIDYGLFERNCHKFTAWCIAWPFILENGFAWMEGSWLMGRLEDVIEKHLNRGRKMTWLPVDSATPGFRYQATPGKEIQGSAAFGAGVVAAEILAFKAIEQCRKLLDDA